MRVPARKFLNAKALKSIADWNLCHLNIRCLPHCAVHWSQLIKVPHGRSVRVNPSK